METNYTKCDYKIEKQLHRQLNHLENLFRDHFAQRQHEIEIQEPVIERLWVLNQRYMILTK